MTSPKEKFLTLIFSFPPVFLLAQLAPQFVDVDAPDYTHAIDGPGIHCILLLEAYLPPALYTI
jgi:hypothetical protein